MTLDKIGFCSYREEFPHILTLAQTVSAYIFIWSYLIFCTKVTIIGAHYIF